MSDPRRSTLRERVQSRTQCNLPSASHQLPRPEADAQPGCEGRPQGRGLAEVRAYHRNLQNIGLHLHQQVVPGRTAVHSQILEPLEVSILW